MARLLIIGPSGAFNATLAKLLEKAGHSVEANGSAPVDVWLVDGFPPDVIVVDAMWPHSDERAYLLALEEEPALGKVPKVLLTSDATRKPHVVPDGLNWPAQTARKQLDVAASLLLFAHAAASAPKPAGVAKSERPLA